MITELPTAALVDSPLLRAAETVANPDRGYDAANYLGSLILRVGCVCPGEEDGRPT